MSHVLSNVETSDAQYQGILARLQQMNQNPKKFVIFLIETTRIFSPEFPGFVNGRPFEAARFHFGGVLVERAQVLHRRLQFVVQKFNVVCNVLVVEFPLAQDWQLFQDFTLDHGNAMLFRDLRILDLLDQVLKKERIAILSEYSTNNSTGRGRYGLGKRILPIFIEAWLTISPTSLSLCSYSLGNRYTKLTLNTARIILVTFSLTESLSMSARIGITLNLFIFSASNGLNVSTHRQNINWYCTWKFTLPERTLKRVDIPSTETNAKRYSSMRSIICKHLATDWMYSLFCMEENQTWLIRPKYYRSHQGDAGSYYLFLLINILRSFNYILI